MNPSLHWATGYLAEGNAYGFSVHNRESRKAFVRAGGRLDPSSPVAIQVLSPVGFEPIPGKFNILYTAWESADVPRRYVEHLKKADMILAASDFLVEPFRRVCPERVVHACPLGVDVEAFPFVRRRFPRRGAFRWLWVGAPNARKGWELALWAFLALRELRPALRLPPMELYIKTTITHKLRRYSGVVWDSRNVSAGELFELYASAHAFVFPSFGEGFGLTFAEALSTGLPAVYTDWSAIADIAGPGFGYPVGFDLIEADYGLGEKVAAARAHLGELVEAMIDVVKRYKAALQKGKAASFRVGKEFTWAKTGERLVRFAGLAHSIMEEKGCLQARSCVA